MRNRVGIDCWERRVPFAQKGEVAECRLLILVEDPGYVLGSSGRKKTKEEIYKRVVWGSGKFGSTKKGRGFGGDFCILAAICVHLNACCEGQGIAQ
ncbi:hypothetical protein ACLOJK_006931 [Asimina triloba]